MATPARLGYQSRVKEEGEATNERTVQNLRPARPRRGARSWRTGWRSSGRPTAPPPLATPRARRRAASWPGGPPGAWAYVGGSGVVPSVLPAGSYRMICPVRYDVIRTRPHASHASAWQTLVECARASCHACPLALGARGDAQLLRHLSWPVRPARFVKRIHGTAGPDRPCLVVADTLSRRRSTAFQPMLAVPSGRFPASPCIGFSRRCTVGRRAEPDAVPRRSGRRPAAL